MLMRNHGLCVFAALLLFSACAGESGGPRELKFGHVC